MSGGKAWSRLCSKFSPSKKVDLSPIKHVCYNATVNKTITRDEYMIPQMWALLNSEEFYYQNTCSLIYHEFTNERKMQKILRDTRIDIVWNERLEGFKLIGQGSYGDVFKGRDKITKQVFAIKRVIKRREINESAESFIKNIFLEKGTLYELNKSNFFVRLLGAFQTSGCGGYWLVMEYCICDLTKLVSTFPGYKNYEYLNNEYVNGYLMIEVNEFLTEEYKIDYKKLIFLYFFEMLCALHYLGTRHIVHTDLKTDNILISQTGHIKMADFGLAYGDSWFYRHSVTILATTKSRKELADQVDNFRLERGNTLHHDPEMRIKHLLDKGNKYKSALEKQYGENVYYKELKSYEQTFLTDIYALGFITVQLLFGGLNLKVPPEELKEFIGVSWEVDLSYNEYLFSEHIYRKFMEFCCDDKERSVMKFLSSLFLPRSIRAEGYLMEIKIFRNLLPITEKIIDIKAIENISFYKSLKTNSMQILNVKFPDAFIISLIEHCQKNRKDIKLDPKEIPRDVLNLPSFKFNDTKYFK